MANLKFDKEITALLVIDPYNDFISEGGKVWDRLKTVAEANDCIPHMLQVLNAARKAELRVFYALLHRYRQATTRPGSTLPRFRRQPGCESPSNTARGAARSAASSSLNRAKSLPRSIGVPVVSPTRIWICNSRNTASISSSSSDSSRIRVWRRPYAMALSLATRSRW